MKKIIPFLRNGYSPQEQAQAKADLIAFQESDEFKAYPLVRKLLIAAGSLDTAHKWLRNGAAYFKRMI